MYIVSFFLSWKKNINLRHGRHLHWVSLATRCIMKAVSGNKRKMRNRHEVVLVVISGDTHQVSPTSPSRSPSGICHTKYIYAFFPHVKQKTYLYWTVYKLVTVTLFWFVALQTGLTGMTVIKLLISVWSLLFLYFTVITVRHNEVIFTE